MNEVYIALLNIISQKVVPHFYVFGSGVKHGIFGNTNGTRAITDERHMGTLLTKITQRVCDPKQLGATTSGSNILGFCGRLSYTRLFARRSRNK
jgi:transposase